MPDTVISRFRHAGTRGLALELQPGVEIWCVEDGRRNSHDEALGGYIVEAFAGSSFLQDDGEIVEHPASYMTYDPIAPPGRSFRLLAESEVHAGSMDVPSSPQLVMAIRKFCAAVGQTKQARGTRKVGSGYLSGHEIDLVRYAYSLTKVVAGGGLSVPAPIVVPKQALEVDGEGW